MPHLPPRPVRRVRLAAAALAVCLASPVLGQVAPAAASSDRGGADPARRAAALVARMTPEEKAGQLLNTAPAIPRLGVPAYQWWNEALHGVVGDPQATNYPEPIGLAAAFDAPLVGRIGAAIADELRAVRGRKVAAGRVHEIGAGLDVWAPNINIFRDPRWGRGQETYGEDPFLTARMGVAYVTGLQGPHADAPRAIATPKHFAVHSGPEPTRHRANVEVSLHDLRDTYLPAFRAAIVEGKAGSVMCAYNAINGQPACANNFLLRQTLRGAWGFAGYVVSDCDAVVDIYQGHKYAADAAKGVAAAVHAGVDNECNVAGLFDSASFGESHRYVDALRGGDLPAADVDRALTRLFAVRLRLGELDRGDASAASPSAPLSGAGAVAPSVARSVATPEHHALAARAAEESVVLLKNDGVLPLAPRAGASHRLRVAVIGPLADARQVLRGNYTSRETSELPSVFDGLRQAMPNAELTLVPAGASATDGDPVPTSALQTEDGTPGVTVRYYPVLPATLPTPHSIGEAMQQFFQRSVADTPSVTRVEPRLSGDAFGAQAVLPQGGRAVASGYLVPNASGTYRLGVAGAATTLTFDGKALVSTPPGLSFGGLPTFGTVRLEASRRYAFTVASLAPGGQPAGLVWQRVSPDPAAALAAAAKDADVVVAVVGITSSLEGEEGSQNLEGFKGGDRTTLDLPADQRRLLETAEALAKPLVVVNMSGSAINLDWAKQHANAVVQAWYPGEAGGPAVGRVLSGAVNPAGRLPVTFYRDVSQLPAFEDYAMNGVKGRTYRYFAGTPVYPFGFGLSYTTFAYGPVRVTPVGRSTSDGLVVRTDVRNTGARAGDEVAQLYLTFPDVPGVPRIALRGFERVHLAPGERRALVFRLTPRDLSSVSPDGNVRVAGGRYRVSVGGGQPGAGVTSVSAPFAVTTAATLPN
ncbi:MAG TPA: glycoside hydrolase family 3 C-terminal domain-containing protein [Gemmatirosa sp.]